MSAALLALIEERAPMVHQLVAHQLDEDLGPLLGCQARHIITDGDGSEVPMRTPCSIGAAWHYSSCYNELLVCESFRADMAAELASIPGWMLCAFCHRQPHQCMAFRPV